MKEKLPILYLTTKLMFSKTWYYINAPELAEHTITYAYFPTVFPTLTNNLKFDRDEFPEYVLCNLLAQSAMTKLHCSRLADC